MGFFSPQDRPAGVVLEKHLSVKAAAGYSGYNQQYLRRLLRARRLQGIKIGQVRLINMAPLEEHLRRGLVTQDRRHGPRGAPIGVGVEVTS